MNRTSLRRELVVGYSVILLASLTLFAGITYAILRQSLARTGTQSLRQTAAAAEQLVAPSNIPRVEVIEDRIPSAIGDVETLRRRTRLITGQEVDIVVARTGDVEKKALRAFSVIALFLIPLTGIAAALAGWSVANRLLKPLNRLVAASREIGIAALDRRVDEPEHPAELRELAQAYNGMLGRLQRAVEALRRFTADASHELRTPLTAIRGTAEVALARPRSPEELRDTMGEILEETRSMLALVEDLLTLARGEEASVPRPTAPVDLVAVLRDVQDIGEALAEGKPVAVRLDAPESVIVHGAAGSLRRLFLNLVSNAVKFTEAGVVEIRVRGANIEGEDPGFVEVQVRDTGSGIAPEELPRVFDRFYRADAARERSGGTGLGLAIVRMIVDQHEGEIHAASTPGTGSIFTVRLPVARVTALVRPEPEALGRVA
ncbi:MAG TPA: ATP-binding protein [Longimicrobium sp.]|jgi:two-component system heavy metal sensor histidine kinase CusS